MPHSRTLNYAETHYKFKLPWSPLCKPWPEVIVDAPYQLQKGQPLRLWVIVKDAHLYPCQFKILRCHAQSSDQSIRFEIDQEHGLDSPMSEIPLDLQLPTPGHWQIWVEGELVGAKGKKTFWNHNLPGLEAMALEVHVLAHELPRPPGWICGDLHVHSDATSDQVEFGASPRVNQDMARQLGLDFVLLTDHSYDLQYDRLNYLNKVDAEPYFQSLRSRAMALNALDLPLILWGQEVSCGNYLGENVHLLVAGYPHFIPGEGDGGRRWLKNRPDLSISQVLDLAQGYPCMAAHPRVRVGRLEKWLFRRGMWHSEDLDPRLCGLQFASGRWNRAAYQGQEFWQNALSRGARLNAVGGSDAHGDFNANYAMHLPLYKLKSSRAHLFGQMKTWIQSSKDENSICQALIQGPTTASNGPWIGMLPHGRVSMLSSPDLGELQQLQIQRLCQGQWNTESHVLHGYSWEMDLQVHEGDVWVVQVTTKSGLVALTHLDLR